MNPNWLTIRPEVLDAMSRGHPVVALESTLISHGLPFPMNLETARLAEQKLWGLGVCPATIAVLAGKAIVGIGDDEMQFLASQADRVEKASTRDLAAMIHAGANAATTVAATMRIASLAGIQVFATGGIGGVHPVETGQPMDISADLMELSQTSMAVVCAGAKCILDLPATVEYLETLQVPILGYQTDSFPGFYLRSTNLPVTFRCDTERSLADVVSTHWELGGKGVVIANPLSPGSAISNEEWEAYSRELHGVLGTKNIHGPALTPFLLAELATISRGKTVRANQDLILANADLAGRLAQNLSRKCPK